MNKTQKPIELSSFQKFADLLKFPINSEFFLRKPLGQIHPTTIFPCLTLPENKNAMGRLHPLRILSFLFYFQSHVIL